MKKVVLVLIIIAIIIVGVIVVNNIKNIKDNEEQVVRNYIRVSDLLQNKIEFNGEICYLFSYDDNEALARYADYVVIAKVDSIEKEYLDFEKSNTSTLGTIKIKKVFKGDLKKGTELQFIRSGGIITMTQFESLLDTRERYELVNLTKEERIKVYGLDKYTQEQKENTYVFDSGAADIPIEKNKTYLMYLKYNENSKRYNIEYNQYGLREVDTKGIILDYNDVRVKDNKTGKYVNINSALSNDLRKQNIFNKIFVAILSYIFK